QGSAPVAVHDGGAEQATGAPSIAADLRAAAMVVGEALTGRPVSARPAGRGRAKKGVRAVPVGAQLLLDRGFGRDATAVGSSAADARRDLAEAARPVVGAAWRRSGRAWLADASRTRADDVLGDGDTLMTPLAPGASAVLPAGPERWDRRAGLVGWRL